MGQYVVKRVWTGIVTLFLVSFLVFGLVNLSPDQIIATLIGDQGYTPQDAAIVKHELGLDKPLVPRYISWLGAMSHGDFGNSIISGRPVSQIIKTAFPVTLELSVLTLIVSTLVGVPLGVYSAVRQDKPDDYVARLFSVIGLSVPHFYLGTMVVVFPAIWWGWVPPLFFTHFEDDPIGNLTFMLVPVLVLATGPAARFARITRSAVLDALREDYVRTARAKGIAEMTVIQRHVLRNALLPVVTVFGGTITFLLAGAVVIETIFSIPGVGTALINAIQRRDFPVITGINAVIATLVIASNLIVDLSYRLLDPRITF